MKATLYTSAWVLLATVALTGCPSDDDETDTTPKATTTAAATTQAATTTTSSTPLQVDTGATNPAITAMAKAELDGKEEPVASGSAMTIPGGRASFSSAADWKTGKAGSWTSATSADEKARFGAASMSASDDATTKANEGATALGLSGCQWGNPESISLGKDKLSAMAADGVCNRGAGQAKAAYTALSGEGVMAVGAWDSAGGDSATTFTIFRSAKKAAGGTGDPTGIAACCAALSQNAASAPPQQKGAYLAAAGACQAALNNPQGRAALAGVRALLMGANVPATCR